MDYRARVEFWFNDAVCRTLTVMIPDDVASKITAKGLTGVKLFVDGYITNNHKPVKKPTLLDYNEGKL